MRILGIESSSNVASIAIVDDNKLICEYTINNTLKHSKTLMPMMEEVFERLNLDKTSIDLLAVSAGPGSFTGLRIGSGTAKGLALGWNIPIVEVPTLEVFAAAVVQPGARVDVISYARATEIYHARYDVKVKRGQWEYEEVESIRAMDIQDFFEEMQLRTIDRTKDYLVGDAVERFKADIVKEELPFICLPGGYQHLTAKHVALLGKGRYDMGGGIDGRQHHPYYHKKSQAEREYEAKHGNA